MAGTLGRILGTLALAAAALVGLASRASAQVLDFPIPLSLDTVVNIDPDPPTPFDEDNDPTGNLATNFAFLTQSAAVAAGCPTPAGLPDNGFFPANADHPDVHLSYSNGSSLLNSFRMERGQAQQIIVPVHAYSSIHLFFASGDGNTNVVVALHYLTGPNGSDSFVVPSWMNPASPPAYHLFDGGDRIAPDPPFQCQDVNTAAIFGYNVAADITRLLASVDVERMDTTTAVLNFYGATGVVFTSAQLQGVTVE